MRTFHPIRFLFLVPLAACFLISAAYGQKSLVLPGNMEVLKCELPGEGVRLAGTSAPGNIFVGQEGVNVTLAVKKDARQGALKGSLEIQEITTRDPDATVKGGYTDTSGDAPRIGLEGKPVLQALDAPLGGDAETKVELKNLPVPQRFGTYALVLVEGDKRTFIGTLCRVPQPRADGTLENTPVFGEFALFDNREKYPQRAAAYERMGIRGLRLEIGWNEREDGTRDWANTDAIFQACQDHKLKLMVTIGGHTGWTWPFPNMQTPAAVGPQWDGNPYWGQADWSCHPKHYPRFAKWLEELCGRYWKDGQGALWGLENYNEPWEGGGISGWARDAVQYRAVQKILAESARKVDPRIKLCAASSIMNTEDKFFADGSREMDKYVDVFTDHYVPPSMCYGPMVAAAHGKESVETETWFVGAEYGLPQIAQFLACGQKRLSPWHPRVLFDALPGTEDNYFTPTPLVAASAAFNSFVTGRPFEKIVFQDHLPWVFQFGKDADPDALLVVFGNLLPIGGTDPKEILWSQVNAEKGGTLTIDNADGLLKFYDVAGNPTYQGQAQVVLPLSIFPAYVTCAKGPAAAAERLAAAKLAGRRPVEIIPRDFTTSVEAKGATLNVSIHNCLNRPLKGELKVSAPDELKLEKSSLPVVLKAGETAVIAFPIAAAKASPANSYACKFALTSDGGDAEQSEVLHSTAITSGKRKIDGDLADWADVPPLNVVGGPSTPELTELLRRPWLDLKSYKPEGNFAEFKLAYDADYLYIAARVNDPSAETPSPDMARRDENAYFHTAASDSRSPFKEFLAKYPGKSFKDTPFVYCYSPERPQTKDLPNIHFRRDRLHIALDVTPGWHDLVPNERVPYGFQCVPDTDYEYAIYATTGAESECWRLLAPGVPRRHDFPRTGHGERSTGAGAGSQHVVRREGNSYIYEVAIPKAELADLKLKPGTELGITLRAGNSQGPHVDFGANKAATKLNGLTIHPYWERSTNCGVRFVLQ